jgi:DNA-binding MltR family transcriptional regulator
MIDTISTFLTTVVELLQTGITGLVDAIAGVFN